MTKRMSYFVAGMAGALTSCVLNLIWEAFQ